MTDPVPGYGIGTPYWKRGRHWSTDRDANGNGRHTGVDISGRGIGGKPILSCTPGRVVGVFKSSAYGWVVKVQWGGYDLWYCHMRTGSPAVKVNQNVVAGQRLGSVGQTGQATGEHLHLEMRVAGTGFAKENFRNPQPAINYKNAEDRERVIVTAKELNVRAAPSTSSRIIRTLEKGFEFAVVRRFSQNGIEWIETTKGNFVAAAFTRPVGSPEPTPKPAAKTAEPAPKTAAKTAEPAPEPAPAPPPSNELRMPNKGASAPLPAPWNKIYHVKSNEWYAAGNSIIGMQTAEDDGYKATDMDSHITEDDVWVLGHDTTPNDDHFVIPADIASKYGKRPTLEKMPWRHVKTLETGVTTWRGKKVRFRYHQVEEVIAWMAGHPGMHVAFEMKQSKQFDDPNTFKALAALCDKYGVHRKRIMIMSIARSAYDHLARFKAAHVYFRTCVIRYNLPKPKNWSQVEPHVDNYRGSWA